MIASLLFALAIAAKAPAEDPAVASLRAEIARLTASRDSIATLRWTMRREMMDRRESWQVEHERVKDSLDELSSRRARLVSEAEQARPRPKAPTTTDPGRKKVEEIRQDMIDRAAFLRDKIRHGIPWEREARMSKALSLERGLEAYQEVSEGVKPLFDAYREEWRFSRSVSREKGTYPLADGTEAEMERIRIGLLGAWYRTTDGRAGILARTGTGEALWNWRDDLKPDQAEAILAGFASRTMDLPVDVLQTQAGAEYFKAEETSFWKSMTDLKHGPLSKTTLFGARLILVLLIVIGLASLVVYVRRNRFVKKEAEGVDAMRHELMGALADRSRLDALARKANLHTVAGRMLKTGHENLDLAPESLEQMLISQESLETRSLESGLTFLGNVAANAAFIGLLGTVLGILDAFAHLGSGGGADASEKVMAAIAEALIATAVGLAVAIPSVVFFNNLSHRVKKTMDEAREMRHLLLAAGLDAVTRGESSRGS